MLGWEILVIRDADGVDGKLLASWRASLYGTRWLDTLAKQGHATDLGGDGYPNRYSVAASVLLPIITAGIPAHDSPIIIGDDYLVPERWSGEVKWNHVAVRTCPPEEILIIEAWDQS